LFANPIPEEFSIPKAEIDLAINQAVQEAAEQGFHGHLNTPFILSRIKDLTMGNSIPANRALIESNVKMATQVAVELEALKQEYRRGRSSRERAKKLAREAVPTGGISKIIRQVRENKEQSPADALDEKFALAEAVLGGSKISNNNDNNVI
jgi:pseudouridine-5'-phosphate glycosidase/pseudouridine kinase